VSYNDDEKKKKNTTMFEAPPIPLRPLLCPATKERYPRNMTLTT
jgi:hypothetical protein